MDHCLCQIIAVVGQAPQSHGSGLLNAAQAHVSSSAKCVCVPPWGCDTRALPWHSVQQQRPQQGQCSSLLQGFDVLCNKAKSQAGWSLPKAWSLAIRAVAGFGAREQPACGLLAISATALTKVVRSLWYFSNVCRTVRVPILPVRRDAGKSGPAKTECPAAGSVKLHGQEHKRLSSVRVRQSCQLVSTTLHGEPDSMMTHIGRLCHHPTH